MELRLINDSNKNEWDSFVKANSTGSFLQSFEWGEFMATQKEKIWRFAVVEGETWKAVFLLVMSKLKMNQRVLYIPRGPVIEEVSHKEKVLGAIFEMLDDMARREKAVMVQIDPHSNEFEWEQSFDQHGFVKSEQNVQPRHTLILDIRKPDEEILNAMHQKTRYNIRLAEKKGIEVIVDNGMYKEFLELLKKTELRQEIKMFSADYFQKILAVPFVKLYLAKYDGKIIAANIMIFWNDTATYLFGASDHEFRNLMAPHLLQWQAIKDAKAANCWFYDFWGAAPPDAKGQEANWFGFTKFKMGFSPDAELTEYLGTYEKIYNPAIVGIYRFLQSLRK